MEESDSIREPDVLRELRPAIGRGRHIAMIAAAGSGHERVFAQAVGAACEPEKGMQALVLVPTRDAALRCATALAQPAADAEGPRLRTLAWPPLADAATADVVVGPPAALLAEIRGGRLGTSALRIICVDGADQIARLEEWPAVEALLDTVGTEIQKIVASSSFKGDLAGLLERRFSRARRWPEELFAEVTAAQEPPGKVLWYGAAARETERLDLLAAAIANAAREEAESAGEESDSPIRSLVVCPDRETACRVRDGLAARGVAVVSDATSSGALVVHGASAAGVDAADAEGVGPRVVIRWGPPDQLAAFTEDMLEGRRTIAIIEARHVAQLRLLARRGGWQLRAIRTPTLEKGEAVERFREAVRSRLAENDVSAELLLLEPLLEEHPAAIVAGALASLLRERPTGKPAPAAKDAPKETVLPAWTRIFLGVGRKDGAGPSDIVGAITGETGAAGGQIGLIEVRPSFTLVDVDAEIADRVIERLRGVRIKGREVTARRDRDVGARRGHPGGSGRGRPGSAGRQGGSGR
jgi:ATP-dependent RNA helicase DeaD